MSKSSPKKTAKKTSKKPAPKKADGQKRPGIISTIVELLTAKPHSKDELLAALVKRFPDRPETGMRQTIGCQVPTRLKSDKGIKVVRDEEGRYSIPK